ncbi:hypothetical protein SADUNF_Sadunf13G0081500 [Salix dunnii]|uniref:Methyltransferase type 11 domain-containing protein n=1 Tax=Salix dunnii TaxID=1413687 RepID=A0A835JHW0_9ROSI|nr:hypothetical protein SADUNF_Sadunf13G0081500 [Salix dunnii]
MHGKQQIDIFRETPVAEKIATGYTTKTNILLFGNMFASVVHLIFRILRESRSNYYLMVMKEDNLILIRMLNLRDKSFDNLVTFDGCICQGLSLVIFPSFIVGKGVTSYLLIADSTWVLSNNCKAAQQDSNQNIETSFVVGDEEFLPIKESSVDLVISCLGLHWTNDLPGAMIQCKLALKSDGLFLAAILGGETLKELRIACTVAQMEREGGISPRISPLAQVRDAGNLLTRAGFTLPGVDVDEYVVRYSSALELIEHLRTMGETNALLQRNNVLKRETALATAAIYDSMFAAEDGTIPATFQVIFMTGWKEHPSQQKAKRRGSATISFDDIQKQFSSDS